MPTRWRRTSRSCRPTRRSSRPTKRRRARTGGRSGRTGGSCGTIGAKIGAKIARANNVLVPVLAFDLAYVRVRVHIPGDVGLIRFRGHLDAARMAAGEGNGPQAEEELHAGVQGPSCRAGASQ